MERQWLSNDLKTVLVACGKSSLSTVDQKRRNGSTIRPLNGTSYRENNIKEWEKNYFVPSPLGEK